MSNKKIKKINQDLSCYGFASSHVSDLLTSEELLNFDIISSYYDNALKDPRITSRINQINKGEYDEKGAYKEYEITHHEFLNSPLTFENMPLIKLYMSEKIIEIAKNYLEELPKLRNPLAWIHPHTSKSKEIRSQKWHRDQEDFKMLKVFILFSDVNENNGPTNYVKATHAYGKYKKIAPNMTWLDNHWSNKNFILKKLYNRFRFHFPYNFSIPKDMIVKATGKKGTIFFIDTNGLHKGGFVKEGQRLMTHCNFLRTSAPMVQEGMPLKNLNSDNKLFNFKEKSKYFQSLDIEKQSILF